MSKITSILGPAADMKDWFRFVVYVDGKYFDSWLSESREGIVSIRENIRDKGLPISGFAGRMTVPDLNYVPGGVSEQEQSDENEFMDLTPEVSA